MFLAATHAPVARTLAAGVSVRRRHVRPVRAGASSGGQGEKPARTDGPAGTGEPPIGVKFDAESALLADIERLKAKKVAQDAKQTANASSRGEPAESAEGGVLGWKERIDGFLMYDFFFICFALLWLGVGVATSTTENSPIMDAWLKLWPFVFQPAIGVLMLAALVSGGIGWAKENKYIQ